MAFIKLEDVTLDIPIFDSIERSLRTQAINVFTGGKILNSFNKLNILDLSTFI